MEQWAFSCAVHFCLSLSRMCRLARQPGQSAGFRGGVAEYVDSGGGEKWREGSVIKQWIQDWDAKFREGDTPWEDVEPSAIMGDLFAAHVAKGSTVFEIGCGLAVNALQLSAMGYDVTATDVSPEAVRMTLESAKRNGLSLTGCQFDVVNDDAPASQYDVVFDKGCLHSFATHDGRLRFAGNVHEIVKPRGLWINISGSADNDDDPVDVEKFGYPRLTLSQLAETVEPYFEVVEIKRCWFGKLPSTSFKAWACVVQKRERTLLKREIP